MLNTVTKINERASTDAVSFIADEEVRFDTAVSDVVEKFLENSDCDIVLLAGPSSSGKTTTAGIIADKIRKSGRNAYIVSLDDFYLNGDDIAINEDGAKDYENVTALDIPLIRKCFLQLIEERKTELPVFDFMTSSRSSETKHIELKKDDVIVVEGLHALNPVITEGLDESHLYKIYISVSSRVTDEDGKILLNKRNLRLIRRTIRDYKHRNASVEQTLTMWDGVLKGEDKFLFPFESYADVKINSFHAYEPCMIKEEALSRFSLVTADSVFYEKAQEIVSALNRFVDIKESLLPEKSLLNEFLSE